MDNSERNGTAYVMINVDDLGNKVPSLVPYDYSSEEEKEQTSDDLKRYSQTSESLDSSGVSKETSKWLSSEDETLKSSTHRGFYTDNISDDDPRWLDSDWEQRMGDSDEG